MNPLEQLAYPVRCTYPDCGEVLRDAIALDEHISEEHLPEAVWTFAFENTKPAEERAA